MIGNSVNGYMNSLKRQRMIDSQSANTSVMTVMTSSLGMNVIRNENVDDGQFGMFRGLISNKRVYDKVLQMDKRLIFSDKMRFCLLFV